MKAVIFAGGLGTRLSEETGTIPKPMVTIGGKPILWHIMKHFKHYGINDFIILTGYKKEIIYDYFLDYRKHNNNIRIDGDNVSYLTDTESFIVTLLDTGINTLTADRLLQAKPYLTEPFIVTYGDAVTTLELDKLIQFHKSSNSIATVTLSQINSKFGNVTTDNSLVTAFSEKENKSWINSGYFVFEPEVFNYITPNTMLENNTMTNLIAFKQLNAYYNKNFWQCMDTMKDKLELEALWLTDKWKVWND